MEPKVLDAKKEYGMSLDAYITGDGNTRCLLITVGDEQVSIRGDAVPLFKEKLVELIDRLYQK